MDTLTVTGLTGLPNYGGRRRRTGIIGSPNVIGKRKVKYSIYSFFFVQQIKKIKLLTGFKDSKCIIGTSPNQKFC